MPVAKPSRRKPDFTPSPIPVPNGDLMLWTKIVVRAAFDALRDAKKS